MVLLSTQGRLEGAIVSRDAGAFQERLTGFLGDILPLALTNNLLKYALQELQMRCRSRLTKHLLQKYMAGQAFYHITAVDGRISNPEQLLTTDVDKFCSSVVSVFQQVLKPAVDAAVYTYKLTRSIGVQGPGSMLGYLVLSGAFLTWLRRPTTRFTSVEQRMEGEYRFAHSRLLAHAEEVAFYGGGQVEGTTLVGAFDALMDHVRRGQQFRYSVGVIDSILAKYAATIVGLLIISRPFLGGPAGSGSGQSRQDMEAYYASARMLLNLSNAMGRLILAGREMARLAGFTARVTQLGQVLEDLAAGQYDRQFVGAHADTSLHAFKRGAEGVDEGAIEFQDVPLATPNNDVLVPSISFRVPLGANVLVAGPNGCGKSSLFRILGGLWPLPGGKLTKPEASKLFYIPQRPYLSLGTLREQLIYPHTPEQAQAAGVGDDAIVQLMHDVQLQHLLQRYESESAGTEHVLDTVADWTDVLSGGEKQRVGMARVFYHRPSFVVNDEATSQVSADAEAAIYSRCRELGMTLFTVSHRRSLWRWHEFLLRFDGEGGYEFRSMSAADRADPFGT